MTRTVFDSVMPDVSAEKRSQIQEAFGRHIVEQRNRMAALIRKWIETDASFPIPIYNRLIDHVRQLNPSLRADVASIALLMADQVVEAVLMTFDKSDDTMVDGAVVNYAIVAQTRQPNSDDVTEEIDVNRGKPIIAIWNRYKQWLSRFASSDLLPRSSQAER